MPAKILGLASGKTDIKITLDSRRKVYSTLDRIQGTVVITPIADLAFDDIDIEFVGTSRTYVERLTTAAAVSGRSQAFHQFLRLSQPGTASLCPEDRILRTGQTYKFPFVFAVPQQLLLRVCTHCVDNDTVRDAHLQLPPSLGDCDPEFKGEHLDDLAPEMASVRYGVYAKISKAKLEGGEMQRVTIVAKARKIRIVPAVDEQPPLDVDKHPDFTLRKEKKLRKGLLKGKLGTLVMEAQQPPSLRLPSPNSKSNPDAAERITTMASVHLRFDPTDQHAQPPRLSNLTSKLKVSTFFATTARRAFPMRDDCINELSNGMHSETLDLSSRAMANVDWTLVKPSGDDASITPPDTPPRRTSSAVSGPVIPPEPSSTFSAGKPYYVARILVPIALPANKTFVPSFHSCLISRTYTLALSLSTHAGLVGNLDLRIPVQISSAGSAGATSPRPSVTSLNGVEVESDPDEADGVDDFFEPRTIHAPEEGYVRGSRLAAGDLGSRRDSVVAETDLPPQPPPQSQAASTELPEYSLFAPGARSRRVGIPAY